MSPEMELQEVLLPQARVIAAGDALQPGSTTDMSGSGSNEGRHNRDRAGRRIEVTEGHAAADATDYSQFRPVVTDVAKCPWR